MSENYKISFDFIQTDHNQLLLHIDFMYNEESISLSLAQLMQFLYANENQLPKQLNDFLFILAKLVKKFDYNHQLLF